MASMNIINRIIRSAASRKAWRTRKKMQAARVKVRVRGARCRIFSN